MSNQSYKVHYDEQIRRFSLPYESSYTQLRKKIEEIFPDIQKAFQLFYVDEEGDQISVNSQTELDEAKRLSSQIIRLIIPQQDSTRSQPQTQPQSENKEEAKPSLNPLAQSSFVQTLAFVQPYLTNPTLLKTVLPFLLSEMNKNGYIPPEELNKMNQMGDQLLEYPFVQDFLSVKLPKILQQITGSTPPPPPPSTPTATEQIQDLVMPLVAMAQSFAQNLSQNINNQTPPKESEETRSTSSTNPASNSINPEQLQELFMPFVSMAQSFAQNVSQNINTQMSPTKQEGTKPTSNLSDSSKSEPTKPVQKEKTATPQPVYQPWGNYEYKPTESYTPPIEKPAPAPTPISAPVPKSTLPAESKFETELKQLQELGFADRILLNELLNENKGDIHRVLDILSEI